MLKYYLDKTGKVIKTNATSIIGDVETLLAAL